MPGSFFRSSHIRGVKEKAMIDRSTREKARNIVNLLQYQHVKIERLLRTFERQLAKFEGSGPPDYGLMERTIALCVDCLDPHHRAVERPLLTALFEQNIVPGSSATTVDDEYVHVVESARRIATMIEAVFLDAELRREILSQIGHEFIDSCRHQMRLEEQTYFPAAIENLKATDWAAIDKVISTATKCVSDERNGATGQALHEKILSWDEIESAA